MKINSSRTPPNASHIYLLNNWTTLVFIPQDFQLNTETKERKNFLQLRVFVCLFSIYKFKGLSYTISKVPFSPHILETCNIH